MLLSILDLKGNIVKRVLQEARGPGLHEVNAYVGDLPAGAYLYQIKAGALTDTKKLIITR